MRRSFEDENPGGIPWSPPTDFENPVPEPGEARRRAFGKALPKLLVVGALIIGVLLLVDTAGDLKSDIEDKIDEVQREIEQQTDISIDSGDSGSGSKSGSDSESELTGGDADGRSSLPGGYASATFTPRGYMAENATRLDVDGAYDGSYWQVTQVGDGGVSYGVLRYYKYVPPLETEAQRDQHLENTLNYDRSVAKGRVKVRNKEIDGRKATEITYTRKADGATQKSVWVLGDPSSYELSCTISKQVPEFEETCDELIDSLKFKR